MTIKEDNFEEYSEFMKKLEALTEALEAGGYSTDPKALVEGAVDKLVEAEPDSWEADFINSLRIDDIDRATIEAVIARIRLEAKKTLESAILETKKTLIHEIEQFLIQTGVPDQNGNMRISDDVNWAASNMREKMLERMLERKETRK